MLTSIIVPAQNEELVLGGTIRKLVAELSPTLHAFEIIIVNDHSTDNTPNLQLPHNCIIINNTGKKGFGRAIKHGLNNSKGDIIIIYMADASDSPKDVIRYIETLKAQPDLDCVFGSRFIYNASVKDYPLVKLAINRLANKFIQVLFQINLNDTTNAFKAYRRRIIEKISPIFSEHFNITVELPLKAISRGAKFTTIPISWTNRQLGVSKLKIREMGSRYLFSLLCIWLERNLARRDYD